MMFRPNGYEQVLAAPDCAWAAGTLAWPAGQASERPRFHHK